MNQHRPAQPAEIGGRDLNWITMKAIEKTRERRYASVSDLAADIERHLADRPVLAGPPSRVYCGGKFRGGVGRRDDLVPFLFLDSQRKPALTDKDSIVLGEFANTTGDPVFDGTLRQGLAIQLGQSPFLSLISEERIQRMLPLMGLAADARLTPRGALEICERTGA